MPDRAPSNADPIWDNWETPPRVPTVPVLHLDGFDGPMDVLLDLAERQRIDFGRMSVSALATQFAAALEQFAEKVPIERRADWLVLATRLVLLRARLLFPNTTEAAAEAEREEAKELRRIDDRIAMRAAVAWLQGRPQLGFDVFGRPQPALKPSEGGYVALMEACLTVLQIVRQEAQEEPRSRPFSPKLWRIADALDRIKLLLAEHPEGANLLSFLPQPEPEKSPLPIKVRAAIASTFAASLELSKQQALAIEQDGSFQDIHLRSPLPISATSGEGEAATRLG